MFDVEEYMYMERKEDDLIFNKQITISDALIGTKFEINLPDGSSFFVERTGVIDPKKRYCVKHKGFPVKNSNKCGDLIMMFDVMYPPSIDKETTERLKQASKNISLHNANNIYHGA